MRPGTKESARHALRERPSRRDCARFLPANDRLIGVRNTGTASIAGQRNSIFYCGRHKAGWILTCIEKPQRRAQKQDVAEGGNKQKSKELVLHDNSTRMPNPVRLMRALEHAAVPIPPSRAGPSGIPTTRKGTRAGILQWPGGLTLSSDRCNRRGTHRPYSTRCSAAQRDPPCSGPRTGLDPAAPRRQKGTRGPGAGLFCPTRRRI